MRFRELTQIIDVMNNSVCRAFAVLLMILGSIAQAFLSLFLAELNPLLGLRLVRGTSRCLKLRVTKLFLA
jgi:hypothetical protein